MELKPYTKEWLEELCRNSDTYAEVLRKAGRSPEGGGSIQTLKNKIQEFSIDISHFKGQGWSKGKSFTPKSKYDLDYVFKKNSAVSQKCLRTYVENFNIVPYECQVCKNDGDWQYGIISLELHHKDGDNTNNEISNLVYLCPNCHALTKNYRGKNKQEQKSIISEEDFVEALKTTSNIRQALIKLDLAPKGGNYTRAKKLMEKYDIQK